jgi:chemotaxis protein histidine kinase CheA
MAEKTKFQYAKSPTGALSGASFIQQTEDAINDIGGKLVEYNAISEETKRKAEQAISTSETALNTANQALTQSAQAIETANTAKAQSDSAVTESRAAKEAAEAAQLDAEESARDAESSRQAAEDANEAAQAAAQRAQTAQDTAETAQENAYAARQAASQAQESATRAEANALLAQSQAAESAAAAEALADGVVRYDSSQTLNASQKTQARTNIGAADASDTYTKSDVENTYLKKTDNAVSASKLQTSRRISATGDATWSVSFNGTQDESGTLTLSASGATAGSYGPNAAATLAFGGSFNVPYVTVDAKGRVTAIKHFALKLPAAQTDVSGNAETASKLETPRTIAISGAVTGTATSFDGSKNISIPTTAVDGTKVSVFGKATSSAAGTIGAVPAPAAGAQGKYLRGDGTWQNPPNTTYAVFKGATSSAAGGTGLVPAPAEGYQGRFLRGDGTWQNPTDNKVSQTSSTANGKYPILLKASSSTSNATAGALFDADVAINPSTGAFYTRKISGKNTVTRWVDAAKAGGSMVEIEDNSSGGEFTPFIRFKSTNGVFVLNGHQEGFLISYLTDEDVAAGSNTVTESLEFTEAGVLVSTGGFQGSLSGNASTASRWSSSRTLTLAGDLTGSVSFNGSANFTLTATIANGSVVTAMIADDAITAAKLATNSVTADAIAANAVGASELANNAVDAAAIASGAVTFAKIASGDIATQSEAEAGTANNCLMTPQRVKQAITANDPGVLQAFLDFADDNNIS